MRRIGVSGEHAGSCRNSGPAGCVYARESVDPRDQTWEVTHPRYRVYFHDAHGAAEELEVAGADVSEILGWAETERRGRTYVLYVCAPLNGLGLVRLQGSDPNEE